MSGDLVSLRMLVIAAAQPDQELWHRAVAMATVPIEFASHAAEAAAGLLAQRGADICVMDAGLSDAGKTAVIQAARAAKPQPLIFLSAPNGDAHIDGIDGMLAKPSNLEEARRQVEICIRAKIPTRVLIVDDSSTMRSIVRKILAACHFTLDIHETAEGADALHKMRNGNFGMVFLDYNMPGLNGFNTLLEIKRINPAAAVVIMTATADTVVADRARAAGALAFLKKPFYPKDVDAVVERYYGVRVRRS